MKYKISLRRYRVERVENPVGDPVVNQETGDESSMIGYAAEASSCLPSTRSWNATGTCRHT
jgi:hypothetical protein